MRRILIALLLAGAAASPALADPQDDHGRSHHNDQNNGGGQHDQGSRGDARGNRPQYSPPPQQMDHRPPAFVQQGQPTFDRSNFDHPQFSAPPQQLNHRPPVIVQQQQLPPQQGYRSYRGDGSRFGRDNIPPQQDVQQQPQRFRFGGVRAEPIQRVSQQNGEGWNVDRRGYRSSGGLPVSVTPRFGTQPPVRVDTDRRWANGWDRDWRYDHRYDWRRYRDHHRSFFHIGIYYDPFGWGYQPFNIGWRLWPAYYSQQYWINDPWDYQLPPPPPGTMWVRYWNDALLVDMYSGEVVDVIRDFFW